MPETVSGNGKTQQQCLLDRDRLLKIEAAVESIDGKVDEILSYAGPISQVKEKLQEVESVAVRANRRIDSLKLDVENQISATNSFIAKVIAFTGALCGTVAAAVVRWLG